MGSYIYWAMCRWRFAHICLVAAVVGLSPSFARAGWSPAVDQALLDPQQIKAKMKLSSEVRLDTGINIVTFFGDYKQPTPNFVQAGNFVHIYPSVQFTDIPQKASGRIVLATGVASTGCPTEIFIPSASDDITNYWALMPLGSYENPLSIWSAYSDDPNCGKTPVKTIVFYQGTLEGIPTTFMLTAARDAAADQVRQESVYHIQVFVFSIEPIGGGGDGNPYFGLFGEYTTFSQYPNSAAALSTEFAIPEPKISGMVKMERTK